MTDSPLYTCSDYRDEMTLLALRNRLNRVALTAKERRQIEEEIRKLERRIGMR